MATMIRICVTTYFLTGLLLGTSVLITDSSRRHFRERMGHLPAWCGALSLVLVSATCWPFIAWKAWRKHK